MRHPLPGRRADDTSPAPAAPVVWRGRPRKAWRYAGVFGDEVMLCAATVSIAGAPQAFWAVWDRRARRLLTQTRSWPRGVRVGPGALRVRARRVRADVVLEPAGSPVSVTSRHEGGGWIWTRKTPVRARGTVLVAGGRALDVDAPGLLDESAGFHARHTAWSWSAGAGTARDGAPVWWNLVDGVHDGPRESERTVWVGGVAREAPPVAFPGDGLSEVLGADGAVLRFAAEAQRSRHDDLGVVASDYRAPFGTFAGTLPGGVELASGRGVMERHEARW